MDVVFPPTSRYASTPIATHEREDGTPVAYLSRRFVPPPERFALLQYHVVVQGERLDNIAAHYFGDPQLTWRLCDANGALRPQALTETVGRRLRITLPEGFPGIPDA
jgi:hypothetical protein